jgi:hypothetical protein
MFSNVALDVCIGLIFVFLLYSLLATIVQEIIAQWLSLRPRMLMKAVRNMLEDRKNEGDGAPASNSTWSYLASSVKRWWIAATVNWERFKCPLDENSPSKAFYQHPAIKYLSESSWNSKPAYIAPSSFANTLIQLLRGENYDGLISQMSKIKDTLFVNKAIDANRTRYDLDSETLRHLQQLYIDAQGDADRFHALLEKWYNDTMDRVAGWYKRQTQFILFVIGLVIALIFNADCIAITSILSKDRTARENLVQLAINSQSRYDTLIQRVDAVTKKREKEAEEKKAAEEKAAKEKAATATAADQDTSAGKAVAPPATPGTEASAEGKKEAAATLPTTVKETVVLDNPDLKEAYAMTLSDINKANSILGLGWDYKDTSCGIRNIIDSLSNRGFTKAEQEIVAQALIESKANRVDCKPRKFLQFHPLQKGGLFTIAGWLLTALAISMGASFWFDLLSKVIRLRAAGQKPAAAIDTNTGLTGPPSSTQPGTTPPGTPAEPLKVTDRKG